MNSWGARLVACLDDGPPDIGALWEICMSFEFDREQTADGIAAWLGPPDGRRILDSACGSGFPALELIARGYDVTCADGSELMLRHFRRNAALAGLDIPAVQAFWSEMPELFGGKFDVVLNRGGGNYKYAGAWEAEGLPEREEMLRAIQQWVACLKPGGVLYIDFAPETSESTTVHPRMRIGDHEVDLTEQIKVDHARRLRFWRSVLIVDGLRYEFQRRSHCLAREEFVRMLAAAGLADVRQIDVKGEFYQVFAGTRLRREEPR
jgi:SAM-dependent methyltransferase